MGEQAPPNQFLGAVIPKGVGPTGGNLLQERRLVMKLEDGPGQRLWITGGAEQGILLMGQQFTRRRGIPGDQGFAHGQGIENLHRDSASGFLRCDQGDPRTPTRG